MSAPHDRPTAAELVEAVREFLESDVFPATTGRTQFHTRVAVNALKMVEREMDMGASQAAAHHARLERLGYTSDVELAAAIRSGSEDGRLGVLAVELHESVRDKLAVANPRYLEGG